MSSTYRKRILARLRAEEKAKENKNDVYVPLKQRKLLAVMATYGHNLYIIYYKLTYKLRFSNL